MKVPVISIHELKTKHTNLLKNIEETIEISEKFAMHTTEIL